ncbi:MAG: TolC family protein [Acidimicrobiia bacterium]|nr:TolC family protein [Acidimicrobiia bacterium]
MKVSLGLLCLSAALSADVRILTLRETVRLALQQSPEAVLSRLEEQQAAYRVQIARDPFIPKAFAGSGLAYSSGFPMSIEGSAPTIVQARGVASVYDRQKKLELEQARENLRGAGIQGQGSREQLIHRTVNLYLEAARSQRMAETARKQVDSAEWIESIMKLRTEQGRELPLELKRAALETAKARQAAEAWGAEQEHAEAALAAVLGMEPAARVRAAPWDNQTLPAPPATAEEASEKALRDNPEIRRLESAMAAKRIEKKSYEAARYPKMDLIAQYGLFARFNNYEDFFQKFQRHNGQLGLSLQIPLWTPPGQRAAAGAADAESAKIAARIQSVRGRIVLDARQSFQEVKKAETARQVARLDLDLARESLSVTLAQFEEGRADLQQVERARLMENEKWLLYYDAQHGLESARFTLLHRAGELAAVFQ